MKPLYDFSQLAVDRTLSPGDTMVAPGQEEQYFDLGRRALEMIRFSAELCDKPHYPDILDLACGHGRVMRWIRAAYDYANITACDVDRDGVNFCAERFRALPAVATADPSALPFAAQFDLIWVGSLVTHLPRARWLATLEALIKATRECGVIVLTTQGRTVATLLAEGRKNVAENVDKETLLADFAREGFAYQRYFENDERHDYGLALSSPEWLMRNLQSHPEVIVRAYLEEAWGMQDVVILYKKTGHYRPVLPEIPTVKPAKFWRKLSGM
ncbi:MAG TPA: class I SAM-dependent methyltransferase [Candidatus Didemnitutus sp.]